MAKWSKEQRLQRHIIFMQIGDLLQAIEEDRERYKTIYNVDPDEDPRWQKVIDLRKKLEEIKPTGNMTAIQRQKYELLNSSSLTERSKQATDLILEGYSAEEVAQILKMKRASVVKLAAAYDLPLVPTFKYKAVPFNKKRNPVYATSLAGINWLVRGVHASQYNPVLLVKEGYSLFQGEWHWKDIRIGEKFSVSNSSPSYKKESETTFFDNDKLHAALRTYRKK